MGLKLNLGTLEREISKLNVFPFKHENIFSCLKGKLRLVSYRKGVHGLLGRDA